jgi:AcrR family transcriptional regulator
MDATNAAPAPDEETASRSEALPAYQRAPGNKRGAANRDRIITAGAELARSLSTWDWTDKITFRAVADRTGLSERTIYRHFPNDRELHAAIRRRLEEEVGVSYEGITLADLPEMENRVYAMLSGFAASPWAVSDEPPYWSGHKHRMKALRNAVASAMEDAAEHDIEVTAAMIDVIWSLPSYERLVKWSGLDPAEAAAVIEWAHELLVEAIENGRVPPRKKRTRRRGPADARSS